MFVFEVDDFDGFEAKMSISSFRDLIDLGEASLAQLFTHFITFIVRLVFGVELGLVDSGFAEAGSSSCHRL